MAERRNYRGPRNRETPLPFKDLRELINMKKQQRELEEEGGVSQQSGGPPPDPPSLLRDSLRGDEPLAQRQNDRPGYSPRGRGYFRRRARGTRNFPQTDRSSSLDKSLSGKLFAYNIKVEVSTETWQRICTIENDKSETNTNSGKKEESQSRGNFRGRRRGRGNYRGQNYYHGQNRRNYTANKENTYDNRKFKTEYDKRSDIPTKETLVPEEDNWDDNTAKYNQIKESIKNQNVEYVEEENWDNDVKSDNLEKNVTYENKEYNTDEDYSHENAAHAAEDQEYAVGDEEYAHGDEEYAARDQEECDDAVDEGAHNGKVFEIKEYSASEYTHDNQKDDKVCLQSKLPSEIIESRKLQEESNVKTNEEVLGHQSKDDVNKFDKNTPEKLIEDNFHRNNNNQEGSRSESEIGKPIHTDEIVNKETSASSESSHAPKVDDKNQEKNLENKNVSKLDMDNATKDVDKEFEEKSLKTNNEDVSKGCDNLSTLNPSSEKITDAKK